MAKHNEWGKIAEDVAADYLKGKGWRILARNWRYGRAEIDIVALDGDRLVVVEVKARSSDYAGSPAKAVTPAKIRRLVEAADAFVREHEIDREVRFDIVEVYLLNKQIAIEHIPGAFYWF
ncbi:MAG: YraN family protein [Chlorobi bacterium]|nr:YraN family protein [Chlorobiota bacterium]